MILKLKDLHKSILRFQKYKIAIENSWRVNDYSQGDKVKLRNLASSAMLILLQYSRNSRLGQRLVEYVKGKRLNHYKSSRKIKRHILKFMPKLQQTGSRKRDCRLDKTDMKELKKGQVSDFKYFCHNMFTTSIEIGFQILSVVHKTCTGMQHLL